MSTDRNESVNKYIFLCVDGSVHSVRAFDWFYDNFYQHDHVIGLVHVYANPISHHANRMADVDSTYEVKLDERVDKSTSVLQRYIDMCKEKNIQFKAFLQEKTESVGRTICNLVVSENPSCIVIGQRGLGAVKRTVYGSVSDFVMHQAHVPVLVVPTEKN